ncbi:MAG: flagellar motor protein MotB, partial [Deltaproteobacteria bacterium]|nr:flagellar motor protein MotB [Deltaproteobacteria bacterium]
MPGWPRQVWSKPVVRKGVIAAVVAVLVYTLFGFLALPPILKSVLSKTLSETLHRKAELRDIRVNPLDLSVSVRGLVISERDAPGTWISAEEVFANLQLASVFQGGAVLSEVRVTRPFVNIVRRKDGAYNFSDLIEEFTKKRAETKEGRLLKLSLNNIRIVDGSIDFDDAPKKTHHAVRGIQVGIPFLSNFRYYVDRYVQPSFSAVVNGKQFSLKGKTKLFSESLESTFDVNISDLDIPHYLEYVPLRRDYVISSAFLDVNVVVTFTQHKEKPPTLSAKGDVVLREVRVLGKDKSPMVRLPMVKAVISPSDLVARDFRLATLQVRDPEVDVSIDRNGKMNLLSLNPRNDSDLSEEAKDRKTATTKDPIGKEPVFSVDSIRLAGAKVRFADASRGTLFRTALGDIRVDVDRLSTEEGKKADARLSFSTESGETVELKGTLSLSPLDSEGTVALAKLVLKKYAPYYGEAVRFDIVGGTLDARSGYRFSQGSGGPEFRLSGLGAALSDLRVRQREEKEEFLRIPELALKDAEVDPGRREVGIGEISTANGAVAVRRTAGGETNVARLVPEEGRLAKPVGAKGLERKPSAGKGPVEQPWKITVKNTIVDRYAVSFVDRTTDPPVEIALDRLRLKADDIAIGGKQRGKFSFSTLYNRQGNISLGGTFSVDPPSVNAKLQARKLPIGPMQPYYTERVKILLTGGSISADGNVSVEAPKDRPVRARFRGEVSVNEFSSMDKALEEEFLRFASLHFGGVDVGYNPTSVLIREISLTDFYSRIIVNPNGTLNVQGIVAKEGAGRDNASLAPAPAAAPAGNAAQAPGIPVRIDTVTLSGGAVNFSDRYIKPNYSASLVELGGRVSDLSSEESLRADVNVRGKLENSAPLEIVGKINPLANDLFLDLKVDFRDMDLSPLSPYSGRFAGYGIQKGKLTLNLTYHIEKKKLDSENKVFLDQFTFGDAVESPDATKLPVRLAVALLKDRKGEIHLDLPVTGSIDDPKFSIWGVVWKIIKNLLVKVATSPFALLGAIFGGGEELSYLEFDPGSFVIPASGTAKLGNLAKALHDRPALKLEIEGHVDIELDREGMRQLSFRRKVAAQKLSDLAKTGQPAPALDNVRVETAEYPKYLARAYKVEKFPKPRNVIGMAKDLPVPEMEKLMLAHIQVTDDNFRQLAGERASHVRDRLVASGNVEPGRIFLVEPKSLPPERKEKIRDS